MKFDRNTVIGFVALAALFFAYFIYTSKLIKNKKRGRILF